MQAIHKLTWLAAALGICTTAISCSADSTAQPVAAATEKTASATAVIQKSPTETTSVPAAPVAAAAVVAPAVQPAGPLMRPGDWNQWGGSAIRNNTPEGKNIPADWNIGGFDDKTGQWLKDKAKNIKWVAPLGSQTYGNPVVVNGKIYVGTNNGYNYLKRFAEGTDLGCLLCFNEADGKFLWQHSSLKLPTGRVHDWPDQGICCAPLVEGNRLWFVTSRGEVACLDTEGFVDGENDGPFKAEPNSNKDEADVLWYFDMMSELGVSQHNMCSCSVTCAGDVLFVCTSNGVDEAHENIPAPNAPSFIALDKNSGKVLWTDNSPGKNVLHGQWSSPAYAVLGGVPQVIFGGGDGYIYSFLGQATDDKKSKLLWKFDCNPKESKYVLSGRATRNHIIGTPVIVDGLVYVGVGEDPEHGEGAGHLWCIDPTKRGDVGPELAFNTKDPKTPIAHKRIQAVVPEEGDFSRPNPDTAAVWHYAAFDLNGDGKTAAVETMHRTLGSVTIKDGILYVADLSGIFHCLDPKTGKVFWTHDLFAACWGTPLVVEGKVYIGDEDGKVTVFKADKKKEILAENTMENSVYSSGVIARNVLYIANKSHLYAIEAPAGEVSAASK